MSHLTLETLARLVDESPEHHEKAHLARCAECASELDALVAQRDAMMSLPDLAPPPDAWPALRAELRREGLLQERRVMAWPLARAAAAAFLFLAGGALGYAVRGPTGSAAATPSEMVALDDSRPGQPAAPATEPAPALEVEEAGERFMDALDRYMANAGAAPSDPAARLAALDNIVLTTAEALNEAPSDPIINGYHLSALAQRNAVLRQLATGSAAPIF